MKLTAKQKTAVLPHLQEMVQSMIDVWESQRLVEQVLDTSFSSMNAGAEFLAVGYNTGSQVRLKDVQAYINLCEGEVLLKTFRSKSTICEGE